jgi:hypothetical protein
MMQLTVAEHSTRHCWSLPHTWPLWQSVPALHVLSCKSWQTPPAVEETHRSPEGQSRDSAHSV